MIAYTEYLTMKTGKRYEILDITDEVERFCANARSCSDGIILGERDAHHRQHFRQRP